MGVRFRSELKPRTRNHRRKNCGTCERITTAHYYLTMPLADYEKIVKLDKNPDVVCVEEINGKFIYVFRDESFLAFDELNRFHIVDSYLRKSKRRLA